MPFFMWFIVAGIFVSAYMTIRSMKEDREFDEAFIEDEGKVYIERMEEGKERRVLTEKAN